MENMIKRWTLGIMACTLFLAGTSAALAVKNGFDKETLPDGSVYEGQFVNGFFDGQGVMTYANGQQYKGEFKDGLWDGEGVLLYTDGSKYEGHFEEGQLSGDGMITYADGSTFKGRFKDGEIYVPPVVDISSLKYTQQS